MWGGANWATSITGTTPDYLDIRNWSVESGEMFTNQDIQSGAKVCVLGRTVVDQLFGDDDPIGEPGLPAAIVCQDCMGDDRRRRVPIAVVEEHGHLIGDEHLKRARERRFRQGVRVDAEE